MKFEEACLFNLSKLGGLASVFCLCVLGPEDWQQLSWPDQSLLMPSFSWLSSELVSGVRYQDFQEVDFIWTLVKLSRSKTQGVSRKWTWLFSSVPHTPLTISGSSVVCTVLNKTCVLKKTSQGMPLAHQSLQHNMVIYTFFFFGLD